MKQIKQAIAFVVYNKNRLEVLTVLRPVNDETLPNVWGLPAGLLKEGETFEEAVIRAGRDKLGVLLKIIRQINEGEIEREKYILHMKEYEVEIISGQPKVPQLVEGVTQYQKWEWSKPEKLKEAALKGSLCSKLFLSYINKHE